MYLPLLNRHNFAIACKASCVEAQEAMASLSAADYELQGPNAVGCQLLQSLPFREYAGRVSQPELGHGSIQSSNSERNLKSNQDDYCQEDYCQADY